MSTLSTSWNAQLVGSLGRRDLSQQFGVFGTGPEDIESAEASENPPTALEDPQNGSHDLPPDGVGIISTFSKMWKDFSPKDLNTEVFKILARSFPGVYEVPPEHFLPRGLFTFTGVARSLPEQVGVVTSNLVVPNSRTNNPNIKNASVDPTLPRLSASEVKQVTVWARKIASNVEIPALDLLHESVKPPQGRGANSLGMQQEDPPPSLFTVEETACALGLKLSYEKTEVLQILRQAKEAILKIPRIRRCVRVEAGNYVASQNKDHPPKIPLLSLNAILDFERKIRGSSFANVTGSSVADFLSKILQDTSKKPKKIILEKLGLKKSLQVRTEFVEFLSSAKLKREKNETDRARILKALALQVMALSYRRKPFSVTVFTGEQSWSFDPVTKFAKKNEEFLQLVLINPHPLRLVVNWLNGQTDSSAVEEVSSIQPDAHGDEEDSSGDSNPGHKEED